MHDAARPPRALNLLFFLLLGFDFEEVSAPKTSQCICPVAVILAMRGFDSILPNMALLCSAMLAEPQMKMCVFGFASTGESNFLTLSEPSLSPVYSFGCPRSRE